MLLLSLNALVNRRESKCCIKKLSLAELFTALSEENRALTKMESSPRQGKKLFLFFTAEAFSPLRESGRHTARG